MKNLVLVAGHAVPFRFDELDRDSGWYLKPFQSGEGPCYVEHVRRGVELAQADPRAVLIFAGGQSDDAAGPRSEGQGYWLIAEHGEWFGAAGVRGRSTTEEFSLDSFENLLFGLCRFREYAGAWPERVSVVGWRFKGPRFELHRAAIRFPKERFQYEGVNDPPDATTAERFETERRELFVTDPYGAGEEPSRKRAARNPFRRRHGYAASCPEAAELLPWRGPEAFSGSLPL